MTRQVGIYGGSFDPIHLGHLNLAVEMMETHQLDEVWFCPAACNPHKEEGTTASAEDRLAMVELAVQGEERFRVSDIEIDRQGLSYTVETLRELVESEKGSAAAFSLILGDDAAQGFHRWHCPEEILQYARPLVGRRGEKKPAFQGAEAIVAALEQGLTPTRIIDISSTEVRQRLSRQQYCGHLAPAKVLDYIFAHHLYWSCRDETRFL